MNKRLNFVRSQESELEKATRLFKSGTADLALVAFTRLIDRGCDEAYSFMGDLYRCGGNNVQRDYGKAKFYYEEAINRTGSIGAYLGLVKMYYHGLGIERDYCKAFEYCTLLADEVSHPHAYFYIGRMYLEGQCVDVDLEKAKSYFKESWKQGYVFGLTYLGFAEQRSGHFVRGWMFRIRAAMFAFRLARSNIDDFRIREL